MTLHGTPLGPVLVRASAATRMREALVSSDQVRRVLGALAGRKLEAVRELVARGDTPIVTREGLALVLGQDGARAALVTVYRRAGRRGER